ncbi:endonuclease I family protein [Lederbergia lenta]|uniref:endonuclease I family protein n=1 Tax=Lederbergia lenta TaxID=1467 RepID=UPI00203F2A80|nr:endonuclease [Lederbergia lenta]MCM3110988.1 endonuclease [Lederbergia lenta]
MNTERNKAMLASLEIFRIKLLNSELTYFDLPADKKDVQHYYRRFDFQLPTSSKMFHPLHSLVKESHEHKIPYYISKDEYLYTWVDLQSNGMVKNIYSGVENSPSDLVNKDLEVRMRQDLQSAEVVPEDLKFNAEHAVPQSWFGGREPMKGDLHHLFACEPTCNAARSNFAYHDFVNYTPESSSEKIQNQCGVAFAELFEPEFGKGTIARAVFYFILRYPYEIRKPFKRKVNFKLLRNWNRQFPPSMYEKHRNQAIFHIQGNRNPFIDFPNLADKLYFPL